MALLEKIKTIFPRAADIPEHLLRDIPCIQTSYLINGEVRIWDGPRQEVLSPVWVMDDTGQKPLYIGEYPLLTQVQAIQAIDAAVSAYDHGQGVWPTMSVAERIDYMERFVFRMLEEKDRVVQFLMWEIGKSLENSKKEFDRTIQYNKEYTQMIISIASGKGGTGKTTVATNLALCLSNKAQLLDCDVEEPNAHLFLNPVFQKKEPVFAPVPQIDLEKCTFCKKCMNICRFGALAVLKKEVLVFENLCHSCGGCFEVCPENAVIEKKRTLGVIGHGAVNGMPFINGRLDIGQVMVPPIIKKVRSYTNPDLITIIDAPPGTSCPVIAAMNKADFIVLVTEPTPFGLHDLKLAVETVKILDIPCGIVINRVGIGNDEVNKYAEKENIPILMEIPFDKKIAQIYSNGLMIVEELPEYREKFLVLFQKIAQLVEKGENNK
jgi:MinD superfamily P-loop ATPase